MKILLCSMLCVAFSLATSSQIVTDNTLSPEDAIELLLGGGIDVSNVSFSGDQNQIGSFDCIDCNVGMSDGIVMASGNIDVVIGPNNSGGLTLDGGNFGATDPDLEDLIPGFTINDAAILEFDFVATGDSVKFNYVWSSEEYLEWVGSSFNDVFGFFLSGPGIAGPYTNGAINIAVVPGTDLPVAIDNVNTGVNSEYYVDNEEITTDETQIQMDGFTVVLTAEAGNLECGETYHIKIAISDAGDTALDSAIFLEAGSFESNSVAIESGANNPPELGLSDDEVLEGCSSGIFTVFRPNVMELDTVDLIIGGDAENGVDFEYIDPETVYIDESGFVEIELIPIYDEDIEGPEDVTITYTYLDGCGDEQVAVATITIIDYIGMELEIEDVFICPGTTETVNATPDNGQSPFNYDWSNSATGSSETFGEDDGGDYMVTVTDFCDSTITRDFTVTVPEPFTGFVPEDDFCVGTTADIIVDGGTLPFVYTYDEDLLTFVEPGGFETGDPGEYEVTITDACGESIDFDLIFENCFTIIPNVFSPNNDGKNDQFFIRGIQGYPGSSLKIYNRWGNLIYENPNYNNTWDGEDFAEGVYYYSFERSDGILFGGHFTLLRK